MPRIENWRRDDTFDDAPEMETDEDEIHHLHWFNPETLDAVQVKETVSPIRHKKKYIVESRVRGSVASARTKEEARQKAVEYMRENRAYS